MQKQVAHVKGFFKDINIWLWYEFNIIEELSYVCFLQDKFSCIFVVRNRVSLIIPYFSDGDFTRWLFSCAMLTESLSI